MFKITLEIRFLTIFVKKISKLISAMPCFGDSKIKNADVRVVEVL